MDYETGTLHYDSCWLDELPVEVLKVITENIYLGYYKNAGNVKVWRQIHPFINCSTDITIREKHSHSDFSIRGATDCEVIDEKHPYYNLYSAYNCQPSGSNRFIGPNEVIKKPEWMNKEFKKLKINGKKVKNDCYFTKPLIRITKKPVDLYTQRYDFRDDPCPCVVREYNNWIKHRKYNLVYENSMVNNNDWHSRYYLQFNCQDLCNCKVEKSTNPIIMNLFTEMYRNYEMKFCDFYKKAYNSHPWLIKWDEFLKDAKQNFDNVYTGSGSRNIPMENRKYVYYNKQNNKLVYNLECSLFNEIVNGLEMGWLYKKYLLKNQLRYGPVCMGITNDGEMCDKKKTQTEIHIKVEDLGEYVNAKKIWPYKLSTLSNNVADHHVHLTLCSKCRDKYIKFKKNDSDRRIDARMSGARTPTQPIHFKIDKFMNDKGYKIKDGYLITNHSNLIVMDRYGSSVLKVKKVDVSKMRFY